MCAVQADPAEDLGRSQRRTGWIRSRGGGDESTYLLAQLQSTGPPSWVGSWRSDLPHFNLEPVPQGEFVSLLCTNNLPSWTAVRESPAETSWVPPLLRGQGEGWAPSLMQRQKKYTIEHPSLGLGQLACCLLFPLPMVALMNEGTYI